jgi:hypothetical protein
MDILSRITDTVRVQYGDHLGFKSPNSTLQEDYYGRNTGTVSTASEQIAGLGLFNDWKAANIDACYRKRGGLGEFFGGSTLLLPCSHNK